MANFCSNYNIGLATDLHIRQLAVAVHTPDLLGTACPRLGALMDFLYAGVSRQVGPSREAVVGVGGDVHTRE